VVLRWSGIADLVWFVFTEKFGEKAESDASSVLGQACWASALVSQSEQALASPPDLPAPGPLTVIGLSITCSAVVNPIVPVTAKVIVSPPFASTSA
jgi:hypothetical protein